MPWELTGNGGTNPANNFLGTTDNQPLAIRTNGQERMRIAPDGRVGIGMPNPPTQRVQLGSGNVLLPNAEAGTHGNLYFGGTTDTGQLGMRLFGGRVNPGPDEIHAGFIDVKTDNTGDGLRIRVDTSVGGTERMRVTANGRVGINTAFPGAALHVIGSIIAGAFVTGSDARLKTDIAPIPDVLGKLQKMRGVAFARLDSDEPSGCPTGPRDIGVIAQEVEEVCPELVYSPLDGEYKGVNDGGLVGVLIEASKELKKENDELRQRIEVLEKATTGGE
jgi:Chaperone of endosialidase